MNTEDLKAMLKMFVKQAVIEALAERDAQSVVYHNGLTGIAVGRFAMSGYDRLVEWDTDKIMGFTRGLKYTVERIEHLPPGGYPFSMYFIRDDHGVMHAFDSSRIGAYKRREFIGASESL